MSKPKFADANIVPFTPARSELPIEGARVGWIAGWTEDGRPLIDFPGNGGEARAARSTVALPAPVEGAAADPIEVVLLFEEQDPTRPIIVGLLGQERLPAPAPKAEPTKDRSVQVELDGDRLVLSADKEIVLRCGSAELILRRNGRVVIRGAYVETRATGVNRIKGGSVQIN